MKQARVDIVKHVIAALTISLKEEEINSEDIPVHMHQRQTA